MNKRMRKDNFNFKAHERVLTEDELRERRRHRQKKRMVREIWIYSGILIVFLPLNLQITMLLLTTFLSFMILDETE